jgi:hypothetical protein
LQFIGERESAKEELLESLLAALGASLLSANIAKFLSGLSSRTFKKGLINNLF